MVVAAGEGLDYHVEAPMMASVEEDAVVVAVAAEDVGTGLVVEDVAGTVGTEAAVKDAAASEGCIWADLAHRRNRSVVGAA